MKYGELNLGQIEAVVNKFGGMDSIMKFLAGELVVVAKAAANKLLELMTSVTVPSVEKFVATDHFKHGETVDGVKCYFWENFQKHFLGKTEKNVAGCDIRIHKLLKSSRDLGIRSEIGEDREETKLAHLWSMLKLQSNGKPGALLTNGCANIFYIRDIEGALWAVSARWYGDGDGWGLSAYSVEDPYEWSDGYQVCSR